VMGGIKNSKNQYGIDEIIARVLSYVLLIIASHLSPLHAHNTMASLMNRTVCMLCILIVALVLFGM